MSEDKFFRDVPPLVRSKPPEDGDLFRVADLAKPALVLDSLTKHSGITRTRPDGSATCWYEDNKAVACRGKLAFIVHDKRGCHLTCQAHAKWRGETSQIMGHSDDCPNWFDAGYKWKHVTVV